MHLRPRPRPLAPGRRGQGHQVQHRGYNCCCRGRVAHELVIGRKGGATRCEGGARGPLRVRAPTISRARIRNSFCIRAFEIANSLAHAHPKFTRASEIEDPKWKFENAWPLDNFHSSHAPMGSPHRFQVPMAECELTCFCLI